MHSPPSHALNVAFAVVPKVPAMLSILGSAFIVYDAAFRQLNLRPRRRCRSTVRSRSRSRRGRPLPGDWLSRSASASAAPPGKSGRMATYHRLLLSMSVCDILSSAALFLSTWPIPEGTPNAYGAVGTQRTCTAQGFFVQFNKGTVLFNGALSVFYLLSIRNGWRPERVERTVEPWLHALPVAFALGTAAAGAALGLYNPGRFMCYIVAKPFNCVESWESDVYAGGTSIKSMGGGVGGVPCVRGDNAAVYNWAFNAAPKAAVLVLVTVIMWLCHRHVVNLERAKNKNPSRSRKSTSSSLADRDRNCTAQTRGHSARRNDNDQDDQDDDWNEEEPRWGAKRGNSGDGDGSDGDGDSQVFKSRRVARQSFLYVGALYLTLLPCIVNRLFELIGGRKYPAAVMTVALLMPMQGFWNALVYLRPRYLRARREQGRRAGRDRRARVAREVRVRDRDGGADDDDGGEELSPPSPSDLPRWRSSSAVAVISALGAAIADNDLEAEDEDDDDDDDAALDEKSKKSDEETCRSSFRKDLEAEDVEAASPIEGSGREGDEQDEQEGCDPAASAGGDAPGEYICTININDVLAPISDLSRSSYELSSFEPMRGSSSQEPMASLVEEIGEDENASRRAQLDQSHLGTSLAGAREEGQDAQADASAGNDGAIQAIMARIRGDMSVLTKPRMSRRTAMRRDRQATDSGIASAGGNSSNVEDSAPGVNHDDATCSTDSVEGIVLQLKDDMSVLTKPRISRRKAGKTRPKRDNVLNIRIPSEGVDEKSHISGVLNDIESNGDALGGSESDTENGDNSSMGNILQRVKDDMSVLTKPRMPRRGREALRAGHSTDNCRNGSISAEAMDEKSHISGVLNDINEHEDAEGESDAMHISVEQTGRGGNESNTENGDNASMGSILQRVRDDMSVLSKPLMPRRGREALRAGHSTDNCRNGSMPTEAMDELSHVSGVLNDLNEHEDAQGESEAVPRHGLKPRRTRRSADNPPNSSIPTEAMGEFGHISSLLNDINGCEDAHGDSEAAHNSVEQTDQGGTISADLDSASTASNSSFLQRVLDEMSIRSVPRMPRRGREVVRTGRSTDNGRNGSISTEAMDELSHVSGVLNDINEHELASGESEVMHNSVEQAPTNEDVFGHP